MSVEGELANLPLLPRDDNGPIFAAPWQAQAFAVVVQLTDAGTITREEWANYLGAALKEAESRGDYNTGERYYDHWLKALEQLMVDKELTDADELTKEGVEILEGDHHRREHQLQSGHHHD